MKHLFRNVKNKQKVIARNSIFAGIVFFVISVLPFIEDQYFSRAYALVLVGIFLGLSSFVIAFIFQKRAKKMDKLLSGNGLLAEWEMDRETISAFVNEMKESQTQKNKALIWVIGFFFLLFTILFMFVLDEDRSGFLLLMGSIFLFIFGASRFFPWYYARRNKQGDGIILLGTKFAYINGFFHNWDFPLSGLTKIRVINTPFHGIFLVYYYTDRTFTNTHELKIPVPDFVDIEEIIKRMKAGN